jgi:hypothetical protein
VETGNHKGIKRLQVFDCTGKLLEQKKINLSAGLLKINIPPAGLAIIQ